MSIRDELLKMADTHELSALKTELEAFKSAIEHIRAIAADEAPVPVEGMRRLNYIAQFTADILEKWAVYKKHYGI